MVPLSLPGGSDGKESACNAGDPGLSPRSGSSSGEGNSNPLQYSCLENSVDTGDKYNEIRILVKFVDSIEQSKNTQITLITYRD